MRRPALPSPRRGGDAYAAMLSSSAGARIAAMLGLPRPVELRRYDPDAPLVGGPVAVTGAAAANVLALLADHDIEAITDVFADPRSTLGGVVVDASTAGRIADLEEVRAALAATVRRLDRCARVIVVGCDPAGLTSPQAAATQQALQGLVRSLAKELREGSTANLIYLADADADVTAAARFLLSGRSAYVNGQTLMVGSAPAFTADPRNPLAGKLAVVTGAARGIGAAIADALHRDGAKVVAVDVPAAGQALAAVANRVHGTALQLDITRPDAGDRLVEHADRFGDLDIVVHNAGITRDHLLVNLEPAQWSQVLEVNLAAQLRIDDTLLAAGSLAPSARMVSVSSVTGIAGNRGQTNYAASKAGVIAMVAARAEALRDDGVTYNAVAPGFIETDMTLAMPIAPRELGRRLNSLAQAGQPRDVAEAVAFLVQPTSAAITGQVLRVCGQSLLGA